MKLTYNVLEIRDDQDRRVAWLGYAPGKCSAKVTDEEKAELGHLIAASPDLLAALENLLRQHQSIMDADCGGACRVVEPLAGHIAWCLECAARAAIAKAKTP